MKDVARQGRVDAELIAMLQVFAGPREPLPTPRRVPRHRASRRAVVALVAALLALTIAVPALALRGQISERIGHILGTRQTPKEFLQAPDEPAHVKRLIERLITPGQSDEPAYHLVTVRRVVDADTPSGEMRLYELRFSNGETGSAMFTVATDSIGGAVWGSGPPCPAGWALRAGSSQVLYPGRTPLYVSGSVAPDVTSVDVVYPDGHATRAVVDNGSFLGWVVPDAHGRTDRGAFSPPVTLIARDPGGGELGRLTVRADGDIPPSPGQARQAVACG